MRKHARPSPINAAARLWAIAALLMLFAALPGSLAFAKESADTAKAPAEEPAPKPSEAPAPEPAPEPSEEPAPEPSEEPAEEPVDEEPVVEEEDSKGEDPAEAPAGDKGDEGAQGQGGGPPQRGTVKVNGVDIDDIPQNQPHQGCNFVIEFRGFEGNGTGTATIQLISPTPGGFTTVSTTLQDDPAGGANDLDGVIVISALDIPGFENVPPHPIQGHHVRIDVEAQDVHKSKVVWIEGCFPGPEPASGLAVFKSCPPSAVVGDTITYEITLQNTGDDDLDIIDVVDSLLGDITGEFPDILPVGDSATATLEFDTSGEDPGELVNTVTATALGTETGDEVSDTAECPVEILPPAVSDIDVGKSCPPTGQVGSSVVYTIEVTNTGDDQLLGLTVEDTVLGDLSGFFPDSLPPGGSATQQFSRELQPDDPDPLRNTVTASAVGEVSGASVSDVDSCRTNILFPPAGVVPPPPILGIVPPDLAVTGAELDIMLRLMVVLSLSGLGLLWLDRRREQEARAAYATAQDASVVPGGMLKYETRSLVAEDADIPTVGEAAIGFGVLLAAAIGLSQNKDQ